MAGEPARRFVMSRFTSFSAGARDTLVAWRLDEVDSPYASPVILGQDQTEQILEQRLNALGVPVRWGSEVVGVEHDAYGVRVRVAHGGAEAGIRELRNMGLEMQQPRRLHADPLTDEAAFRERAAQPFDRDGVAPVNGGERIDRA